MNTFPTPFTFFTSTSLYQCRVIEFYRLFCFIICLWKLISELKLTLLVLIIKFMKLNFLCRLRLLLSWFLRALHLCLKFIPLSSIRTFFFILFIFFTLLRLFFLHIEVLLAWHVFKHRQQFIIIHFLLLFRLAGFLLLLLWCSLVLWKRIKLL